MYLCGPPALPTSREMSRRNDRIHRKRRSVRRGREMGEKGNLLDMGQEVLANLAEQGPDFWIAFEQYRQARAKATQASPAGAEPAAGDPQRARRPAAE
jgi:hypothetical protein